MEPSDEQVQQVLQIAQSIGAERGTYAEAYTVVPTGWGPAIEGPFSPQDWTTVNDRLNDEDIPVHVWNLTFGTIGIGHD